MLRNFAGFMSAAGLVVCVACGQTDAGITTNVKTKLAADDTVKAYQVDVDTSNHVVTLSGSVDHPAAKAQAVMIARNTDGVTDVIDQITIDETAATSGIRTGVDIDVEDDLEGDVREGARDTGNALERAGEATVDGAKKAGEATADGARKVGSAIKDAVTDDDPDSDNDGR